jgi:hypothetical protein
MAVGDCAGAANTLDTDAAAKKSAAGIFSRAFANFMLFPRATFR